MSSFSDAFDNHEVSVTAVGGYSKNINYDAQHCIVRFGSDIPTSCSNKVKGVIYTDKQVGNLMCSIALTALASNQKVKISSTDDCDSTHAAPILRCIEVVK